MSCVLPSAVAVSPDVGLILDPSLPFTFMGTSFPTHTHGFSLRRWYRLPAEQWGAWESPVVLSSYVLLPAIALPSPLSRGWLQSKGKTAFYSPNKTINRLF